MRNGQLTCQVAGCSNDLSTQKPYNQAKRLCGMHMQAPAVSLTPGGELLRFCFQCGRLESLSLFDGVKRSCRVKLRQRRARAPQKSASLGNLGYHPAAGGPFSLQASAEAAAAAAAAAAAGGGAGLMPPAMSARQPSDALSVSWNLPGDDMPSSSGMAPDAARMQCHSAAVKRTASYPASAACWPGSAAGAMPSTSGSPPPFWNHQQLQHQHSGALHIEPAAQAAAAQASAAQPSAEFEGMLMDMLASELGTQMLSETGSAGTHAHSAPSWCPPGGAAAPTPQPAASCSQAAACTTAFVGSVPGELLLPVAGSFAAPALSSSVGMPGACLAADLVQPPPLLAGAAMAVPAGGMSPVPAAACSPLDAAAAAAGAMAECVAQQRLAPEPLLPSGAADVERSLTQLQLLNSQISETQARLSEAMAWLRRMRTSSSE